VHDRRFAFPGEREDQIEIFQAPPQRGVARGSAPDGAETRIAGFGHPLVAVRQEAADGEAGVRVASLGQTTRNIDELGIDLDPVRLEAEKIGHDGDNAGRRAPLQKPQAGPSQRQ
jgi:hypothetical protein